MPFTVTEYLDLVRLLGEHPEWRTELRRLLLADDILELPRIVRELAEAQERTESRLERLEATVERLAEAQERTESRLERLEATVERLAEAQERTESRLERLEATVERLAEAQERTESRLERLEAAQERTEVRLQELAEAQRHTEEQLRELAADVQVLTDVQQRMLDDLAGLKGWALEEKYRKYAYGYFGRWLRRARPVELIDLTIVEEAYQSGQLSDEEWKELAALDLVVQGRAGRGADARDVLIALEVSSVIDESDVERAHRRAELLCRLGYTAVAGVGGETIRSEAEQRARDLGVTVALDGRVQFWAALPGPTP